MGLGLRLVGTEGSYYTAKVRAYLRWKALPFSEIPATRRVYAEHEVFRSGIRSLPVLYGPEGETLCDSTDIIDWVEARVPDPPVYPSTALQRFVALALEVYADEWLFVPAMHLRWSFPATNREFLLRDHGTTLLPDAPPVEQRRAGAAVERTMRAVLPWIGVTAETAPALEQWYDELLDGIERHLVDHPCLLGARPSIGDFALMGLLYAHGWRDPHAGAIMRRRARRVSAWVETMHAGWERAGTFVPGDVVPDTTAALLRRFFAEQVPVLLDTVRRFDAWVDEHRGVPVPRFVGRHDVRIGGVTASRAVIPYSVSMLQRVVDHLHGLADGDRDRVADWLERQGGGALLDVRIRHPLRRVANGLELVAHTSNP
jgi:glutathione S-transferase